jgi:hypothetical protein
VVAFSLVASTFLGLGFWVGQKMAQQYIIPDRDSGMLVEGPGISRPRFFSNDNQWTMASLNALQRRCRRPDLTVPSIILQGVPTHKWTEESAAEPVELPVIHH